MTRRGAVVQEVTSGSPAAEADLAAEDVIVAIDGRPVAGAESLTAYVRERRAGEETELTVVRDGEALTVPVDLAVREASLQSQGGATQGDSSPDGSLQDGSQIPGFDWFGGQG